MQLAGHRGEWPHRGSDCFLMRCADLYRDLLAMQEQVVAAAGIIARENRTDWLADVIRDDATPDYIRQAAIDLRDWQEDRP